MHPPRVVVELDVFERVLLRLLPCLAALAVHQLALGRLEEGFRERVVPWVARPRPGLGDPVGLEASASKQACRTISLSRFSRFGRESSERLLFFFVVAEGRGAMSIIGSSVILAASSAASGLSLMSAGTDSDHGISESR